MLTEPQVQRYSRQILLREVGGRGQERLLASPWRVELPRPGAAPGTRAKEKAPPPPALAVALSYLAAGGTPLELPPFLESGAFLAGTTLLAFNPDAVPGAVVSPAPAPAGAPAVGGDNSAEGLLAPRAVGPASRPARSVGALAAAPAWPSGPGHWILLSRNGAAFRAADACAGCFSRTAAGLEPDDDASSSVVLGPLAALLAQRLVLGFSEPLGGVSWDGERLRSLPVLACAAHGGA